MRLIDCETGKKYTIIKLDLENKRIENFGFKPLEKISVLYKTKSVVFVSVLVSFLAIDKKLAEDIIVLQGGN